MYVHVCGCGGGFALYTGWLCELRSISILCRRILALHVEGVRMCIREEGGNHCGAPCKRLLYFSILCVIVLHFIHTKM